MLLSFFPGSSIGNFERDEAAAFLARVRSFVGSDGGLLLGVDMKKDESVLNAAYNDSEGLTAAFNLNMLSHINNEFDADFDLDAFEHHAVYSKALGCIQMFLVSSRDQVVNVADRSFEIAEGEAIHTENSHKYTIDEMTELANAAGFHVSRVWRDEDNYFAVIYLSGERSSE